MNETDIESRRRKAIELFDRLPPERQDDIILLIETILKEKLSHPASPASTFQTAI